MKLSDLKKIKIPDSSGVYFFKKGEEILYIGRATSLVSRVKSYFLKDILTTRGPLILDMTVIADDIAWQETDSVLEAIILEANLIKKFQPKYNTKEKDDKSFNYIVITDEAFPRILSARGRDIDSGKFKYRIAEKFGPYTKNQLMKDALKVIRKIIPFRDNCEPLSGKACFNSQIGLCPGVCGGDISEREYAENVEEIRMILKGETGELKKILEKNMHDSAKKQDFEKANLYKNKLFSLKHIADISLIKDINDLESAEINVGGGVAPQSFRIEAYDISHFGGSNAVGVMIVLENGILQNSEYRVFNIRNENGNNESANTEELISRRFNHKEWPMPNLIVLDGADIELKATQRALKVHNLNIPIVNVIKDKKHRPKLIKSAEFPIKSLENLKKTILLANSEAHRFSLKNQKRRRTIH